MTNRWFLSVVVCTAFFLGGALRAQEPQVKSDAIVAIGERSPEDRSEPICAGIPLALNSKVTSTNQLVLVDAQGTTIPARIAPLARSGGPLADTSNPVSWAEVCFALNSKHKFPLHLATGKKQTSGMTLATAEKKLHLTWNGRKVVFDPKEGALLSSITEKGQEILAAPALEILFWNHKQKHIKATPWTLWVEKTDSAATTILASAHVADLLFQLRMQFIEGCDDVLIQARLMNEGPYGHMNTESSHVWFDRLSLTLPRLKDSTKTTLAGQSFGAKDVAVVQTHITPYKKGQPAETFQFQVIASGKIEVSAEKFDGTLAVGTKVRSFGYGMTDFWQNAPKAWSVHESVVLCDLFPAGGSGPHHTGIYGKPGDANVDEFSLENYRFEGSRAKSFRLHIDFGGKKTKPCAARMSRRLARPLHVSIDPEALAGRRLLGYVITPQSESKTAARTRFERFQRILVDDAAADNQDALGMIGLPQFIKRGGTYGRSVFYGWFNYGDLPWGDGYCSLHYDLPFTTLMNFLRTGDARLFKLGSVMTRHRRDIDQDHDRTSKSTRRGGQFYEKGWFHGNYYHPHASHTWTKGPLLHYLLTGDTWSLEAAELNRDFLRRGKPETWNGDWGSRIPGWTIENLVALYEVLGNPDDLRMAHAIAMQYEKIEQNRDGGQGFVINKRMKPKSWKPWMANIMFNAVAMYRLETNDKSVDPLLDRMAKTFRKLVLRKGASSPWTAARNIVGTKRDRPSVNLIWPMTASFSLLARIHQRPEDIALANELFTDAVNYFQERLHAPLAFRVLNYPNSESKIHSGIQLWGLHALPIVLP